MKSILIVIALVATACNPKLKTENNVTGHVDVTASTITVNTHVQLSGDAYFHIVQTITTDPALQRVINQACNGQIQCSQTSLNNIIGSITNNLTGSTL